MTATKQQPIAGYRISDPSDPELGFWFSETPCAEGYTSEPLYAGAAPAAVAGPALGTKFFSASNEGLDEHDTAEAAQNEAQSIIDMYREEAADGWPEEVDSVCWGVILGKAVERPVKDAPFMAGILGSDMEPVDYVLEPVAAPALEAPAAPACPYTGFAARYWTLGYQGHDCPPTTGPVSREAYDAGARARLAAAPQAPAAPSAVEGVAQFRKRPVTISAIQWTGKNLREVITFTDGPPETRGTHAGMAWEAYTDLVERDGLMIYTLEGKMHASVGDWIIRGVKGEHYACKPDIFAETYEPAMAAPAAPAVEATAKRDAAFEAVRQRLCRIPRWSFHIDSRGNIRRVDDASGNWIEFSAAHQLFDPVAVDAAIAAQAAAKGSA